MKLVGSRPFALLIAIRALVLAGLPTTRTLTSGLAAAASALPCVVKMAPFAESRSDRSMPALRGMAPTSRAMSAPAKARLRVVGHHRSCQQREGAVLELHRHPFQRGKGWWYLEHLEDHRLLGAEHLAGSDPEHQAVADLAGGPGDRDPNRFSHVRQTTRATARSRNRGRSRVGAGNG